MHNTENKEPKTPQTGNVNPQMGEANKKMIERRLNDKEDPLTFQLIKLVCPEVSEVISCCAVRSKDDSTLKNSEIAFIYEVKLNNNEVYADSISIAAKGSIGLGSLNQLALFWLNTLLNSDEISSPAGQALTLMAGATQMSDMPKEPVAVGDFITGINSSQYGMPLQLWLGEEDNLKKFINKGLNIQTNTFGKNILLLNMREAGLQGEDIFIMTEATSLSKAIINEAIQETNKKQKFVKINSEDKVLKLSRAMSLKRVGGNNARGNGANQLQIIVNTKGLLDMIVNPLVNNKINSFIAMEEPKLESIAITLMNPNSKEEKTFTNGETKLLKKTELITIDLDSISKKLKKPKF